MKTTELDLLFEGLSAEEAKQLRKILAEWRVGDDHSFPVQLALLTRAQWKAAAQTPILITKSYEQLDRMLADHRQQTVSLLKQFQMDTSTKTQELGKVIAGHKKAADAVLTDLRGYATAAKSLLGQMDRELTKGTAELKRYRDEFITERARLAEERMRYEQQKSRGDWIVLASLLLAMVVIGMFIGWRWF